jgi:uncharacterized membrane protein YphA (DoxX/SURF4 family)
MRNIFAKILGLFLGSLYAVAACLKLLDLRSFLMNLDGYGLLPSLLVAPAALAIIAAEIVLGVALAAGFKARLAALLLAGMTFFFAAAIYISFLRGSSFDCGCFGPVLPEEVGLGALFRDILLIVGCLWIAVRGSGYPSSRSKAGRRFLDVRP